MQNAEAVLGIIRERGRKGLPLERLYRCLFNPELYLAAYGRIYRNDGALTPGVTGETVDGMRLTKIQAIIDSAASATDGLPCDASTSRRRERATNAR